MDNCTPRVICMFTKSNFIIPSKFKPFIAKWARQNKQNVLWTLKKKSMSMGTKGNGDGLKFGHWLPLLMDSIWVKRTTFCHLSISSFFKVEFHATSVNGLLVNNLLLWSSMCVCNVALQGLTMPSCEAIYNFISTTIELFASSVELGCRAWSCICNCCNSSSPIATNSSRASIWLSTFSNSLQASSFAF